MELLFGQHAGWFAAPAILGTAFFIIRLVFMMTGLSHAHDVGMDIGDAVGDPGHTDPSQAFKALSIQSAATFMMGFGWAGLGAYRGMGLEIVPSVVVGIAGGLAMVWLLGLLLKAVYDLQSSGNIAIADTVGRVGDVYLTVPSANGGRGQVRVTINNRQRVYDAVTDEQEIKPPSRVRIIRVNGDHTLTVVPA